MAQQHASSEDWLTPQEVADRLNLTYLKVLNLINAGEFPGAINTGGEGTGRRYRVALADVDRWVQSRQLR